MALADQAALVMLSRLAERGVGIVSVLAWVRLLTQEDFGTYLQVYLPGMLPLPLVSDRPPAQHEVSWQA